MDTPKPPIRHCDECRWFGTLVICRKGHKPRFYGPRNPLDQQWGHKRRCEDFTAADGTPKGE